MRTAEYVGVVTFGTVADAERAGARVRGIHRQVSGVEPESGRPYRADHPELLSWVHCSEVDSFLACYRRSGGRMTGVEADRYVAEQTRAGALVGLDPRTLPVSVAELAGYYEMVRMSLRLTAQARRTARFVLLPPALRDGPHVKAARIRLAEPAGRLS